MWRAEDEAKPNQGDRISLVFSNEEEYPLSLSRALSYGV